MDDQQKKPVFFDPQNKRWPRVKNSFYLILFSLFFLIVAFLVSVYLAPAVNELPLASVNHLKKIAYHPVNNQLAKHQPKYILRTPTRKGKRPPPINSNAKGVNPVTIGFLVNYDDASFRSLAKNINDIDIVIADFLHISSVDGDIVEDDPQKQSMIVNYLIKHRPQLKIIPLISNIKNENWQPQLIESFLASPTSQKKLIQSLLQYIQDHHFAGVNIDFEEIPEKSQKQLTAFIKELSTVFHQHNLTVSIDIVGGNEAYNIPQLTKWVDYIVLMAYDEHWEDSEAGPIASLSWFTHAVTKHLQLIPNKKLVIGLGNYGYDWIKNKKGAEEINFQDLMITSDLAQAPISFNQKSLNPTFDYLDEDNKPHSIWFLDAATVFNQLAITQAFHPYGYSIWRLGSEDPTIWKLLGHKVGAEDIKNIEQISTGYAINYQGKGEIINVSKKPQTGTREITYDAKQNIITNENYKTKPTSYVLNRFGGSDPKKIAITFDDGPDPQYTAKILDILKETNTHASFFVIGANAMLYPKLLKRELDEGHDIGNHTFTHPNISAISQRQLIGEVTMTQRLLESYLDRGTHLFRPPYAEDTEPETAADVNTIDALTDLGYLTIGMNIDPNDWMEPGVDAIVNNVISSLDNHEGNIILLHDSGGNREQTIAALPQIIAEIRARGYQLVTVSELLNLPQSQVMPRTEMSLWEDFVNDMTFNIMYYGSETVKNLFFVCIILGFIRLFLLCILAIYQKHKDKNLSHEPIEDYSVAVIVPAYNEGKVILKTIDRLLKIDHPKQLHIFVVNDGSTDNTQELLEAHYSNNPLVTIIQQENGGKASALNNAIAQTNADIIVTLDGDTLFSQKTIMELVCCFDDPEVGAVAGNIKVGNKINLLTKMQSVEYITSQNLERRAFKVLNAITVIPGSVGAWRRSLVVEADGFTTDTLAEDADLTLKLRRLGCKIVYADKATAFTEAPDTIKSFLQQRYRWMYGTFQVAWKHVDTLFRPKYGYLGWVALPSIFIYQIIYPFIAPIMDLLLVLLISSSLLNHFYHPDAANDSSLKLVLLYYLVFTLIDFLAAGISFLLESKENKKALWLLLPQRFFYRQLIYYVAIKTIISSLRGGMVGWNKVVRKATVKD